MTSVLEAAKISRSDRRFIFFIVVFEYIWQIFFVIFVPFPTLTSGLLTSGGRSVHFLILRIAKSNKLTFLMQVVVGVGGLAVINVLTGTPSGVVGSSVILLRCVLDRTPAFENVKKELHGKQAKENGEHGDGEYGFGI